jgi:3-hydroxyisobutyrate dehydrogenase-like beta-hydroxyacid dehydrogenase
MSRVAFLGTGLLGSGMIEAMLRRGVQVSVWNRTMAKARALEAFGAKVEAAPEDAVAGADRVHLALPDDAVVDAMLNRIGPRLSSGTIVIDHSTTAPEGTKARLKRASASNIAWLHAPVFMSPQMCRDCVGLMMVSGPQALFDRVRPHLEKMTGEVWYLGEREDLAASFKIMGNSMIFAITAGLSDVLAMARSLGIAPMDAGGLFSKFKVGSVVPARMDKMARADYSATFELTMARKDIRLMIEAAGAEPLTVLPSIAQRMDQAIANGHGQEDLGAIAAR